MFQQACPWCGEKISIQRLGRRFRKIPPKWYGFTRYVLVCPYCNGIVKQESKGRMWGLVFLFLPLAVPIAYSLLFNSGHISDLHWVWVVLAAFAAVNFLFFIKLEKSSDPNL